MSPEIDISVSETRSKFAFLFNSIAELYRFYYGKKLSTKFEDVKKMEEVLVKDGHLNDYLQSNLDSAFGLYPTLLPGVVAQNFRTNAEKEQERINKLGKFLDILIGDICGEINDKVDETEQYEKESIIRWLNQQ